jgi:hypothetical protein
MGVLERQAYTATTALSGLRGGRHMLQQTFRIIFGLM